MASFFYHSIFITHHSIFHTHLASSLNFHHSIFFTLFVGPYLSTGTTFFFFLVAKLTEANIKNIKNKKNPKLKNEPVKKKKKKKNQNWRLNQWKKKKKKELKTNRPNQWKKKKRKKKKKKEPNSQPREKKKVKVVKNCGWYCLRVPHVCLITKMTLSYELWKLKTTFDDHCNKYAISHDHDCHSPRGPFDGYPSDAASID